ncbi:MAG TPA: VOC family protein [Eoetvoesiella sp.]
MSQLAKNTTSTIIPCLRYRNAAVAIEWLCNAFGFKKKAVYANEDGTIAHAQLTFGNGMIMLGSVTEPGSKWGRLIKQPDEIERLETQSAYLVVANADAIYDQARAVGAEIVLDIKDEDYGGRGFSCRDIEGHLWNFGTYDPWKSDEPAQDSKKQ